MSDAPHRAFGSATDGATAEPVDDAAAPRAAHVEVPRTARYWTVGDRAAPRALWVALHGYGQLAGYFVRHFAEHAAAGSGRLVVAPEALSRFYLGTEADGAHAQRIGATWMTREDRAAEIRDYVRWLDRALDAVRAEVPAAAGAALHVLAFSQGVATACRWLADRHQRGLAPAAGLVLWGGALPPDLSLDAGSVLHATPLTLVVGDADAFATPALVAEQEARLRAAGVAFTARRFAGGHRLDRDTLAAVLGA